jgi:ABC-2 type transport system permease protein
MARRHECEPLRPIRLAWTFFRIGTLHELQYRVNLLLQLVESVVALGTALVVLSLVFTYTEELAGWTRYELLAVMGVHILMGGVIHSAIQPNMERLIDDIREGTLDYWLTKPEDAQTLASVREFRLWRAVDIIVGAIVLVVAILGIDSQIGPAQALAFAAALLLGGLMIYCFWLILTVGAFWIVRMEFIVELFEGVYQAGRWPVGVYPPLLRGGLTFLVPLGFAITVPAEAVAGRLSGATFALAVGFAAVLFAVTRWLWRTGLRRYSGASA